MDVLSFKRWTSYYSSSLLILWVVSDYPRLLSFFSMESSFENWSAHDIVGPLNRAEIRSALLDFKIEKKCFRTWNSIEEMILSSSDAVKRVVYESSLVKRKIEEQHRQDIVKRKREDQALARNVRRRCKGAPMAALGCVLSFSILS